MPSAAANRLPDPELWHPSVCNGAATDMTDFAEDAFEERTVAVKRDFETRAVTTDVLQSVQLLASFVSNFGKLVPSIVTVGSIDGINWLFPPISIC